MMVVVCALLLGNSAMSGNKPDAPAGPGNGILGFGIGPGVGYYGSSGFGPAILVHYDHSIWQAGPGTISLGGQIGASFFNHTYYYGSDYKYSWTNFGFDFRGAYHYGWDVPGLDTYGGFGIGACITSFSDGGWDSGKSSTHVGPLPTFFLGGSYFFNDVVGVNAETGYNFSFFSVGMNFRIIRN